jgi:hypothetical protein
MVSDKLLITSRIDKDSRTLLRIALEFGKHVEVPAMGSQKYVARQSEQRRKRMLEILSYAGVAYGMPRGGNDVILRPKPHASDNDDIPHRSRWLSWKVRPHRPCGTSTRMAGGFVGGQSHSPQAYGVPIMQGAIHMYRSVCGDVG